MMGKSMLKRAFSLIAILFLVQGVTFFGSAAKADVPTEYLVLSSAVKIQHIVKYTTWYGTAGSNVVQASGVLLKDGTILSCYHVLDGFATGTIKIMCFSKEGTEVRSSPEEITVLAYDKSADLLLLGVNPPFKNQGVALAKAPPFIGDKVFIAGHTAFAVTRLRIYHYLESTLGVLVTPVYFGDSGGGVFDVEGNLVGIIQRALATSYPTIQVSYYGYAAPLATLAKFLKERPGNER